MNKRLTRKINDRYFCAKQADEFDGSEFIEANQKLGQLEDIEERIGIDLRDLLNVLTGSVFVNTELGIYELNGSMCYIDKERQALCCYFDANGKFLPFKDYGTYWSANREDVVKWRKENGWE